MASEETLLKLRDMVTDHFTIDGIFLYPEYDDLESLVEFHNIAMKELGDEYLKVLIQGKITDKEYYDYKNLPAIFRIVARNYEQMPAHFPKLFIEVVNQNLERSDSSSYVRNKFEPLIKTFPTKEVLDFLEDIIFNWGPVDSRSYERTTLDLLWVGFGDIFEEILSLYQKFDRLDYSVFRKMVVACPMLVSSCQVNFNDKVIRHNDDTDELYNIRIKLQQFINDLYLDWESEGFCQELETVFLKIQYFYGYKVFINTSKLLEKKGRLNDFEEDEFEYYEKLLSSLKKEDEVHSEELIECLKTLKKETLEDITPFVGKGFYQGEYLGFHKQIYPLLDAEDCQKVFSNVINYINKWESWSGIANSTDPSVMTLTQEEFNLAKECNPEHLSKMAKLYEKHSPELADVMDLFAIAAGAPIDQKKLKSANQHTVRKFGLAKLEKGIDEALERYLWLDEFLKIRKSKSGNERYGNEKAAVQACKSNLAMNLGLGSITRLEWNMEARLGKSIPKEEIIKADKYDLIFSTKGSETEFYAVNNKGKRLKSIPAALKKSDDFKRLKDLADKLKDQERRFKISIEELLMSGEYLEKTELENILNLESAAKLLIGLIFQTDTKQFGLLNTDKTLSSTEDTALDYKSAKIAHPVDLIDSGKLSAWQSKIITKEIIQPLKQAFREAYVLTDAERESQDKSFRFSRKVKGSVFGGLLKTRNWNVKSSDGPVITKQLPGNIWARIELSSPGHYLGENEQEEINHILFCDSNDDWSYNRIALEEIPPCIFSEVMRDCDLFVSVAAVTDEDWVDYSKEAFQRVSELVMCIAQSAGLENVRVDGRYVKIKGKLAEYRIHTASTSIHVEPGSYLCIIPAKAINNDKVYLPFADQNNSKTAELISKIFLLANDDQIKDKTILSQIKGSE